MAIHPQKLTRQIPKKTGNPKSANKEKIDQRLHAINNKNNSCTTENKKQLR